MECDRPGSGRTRRERPQHLLMEVWDRGRGQSRLQGLHPEHTGWDCRCRKWGTEWEQVGGPGAWPGHRERASWHPRETLRMRTSQTCRGLRPGPGLEPPAPGAEVRVRKPAAPRCAAARGEVWAGAWAAACGLWSPGGMPTRTAMRTAHG